MGSWFFEDKFLIKLIDSNGTELGKTIAKIKGEWTMNQYIPFEAVLVFKLGKTGKGKIIFERGNPALVLEGLPKEEFVIKLKSK